MEEEDADLRVPEMFKALGNRSIRAGVKLLNQKLPHSIQYDDICLVKRRQPDVLVDFHHVIVIDDDE